VILAKLPLKLPPPPLELDRLEVGGFPVLYMAEKEAHGSKLSNGIVFVSICRASW